MKSLADFKRAMKVGSKWEVFNHLNGRPIGIREVIKFKGNSFAFKTQLENGEEISYWSNFPKASEISFKEDGTVDIYYVCSYTNERKIKLSYKQA